MAKFKVPDVKIYFFNSLGRKLEEFKPLENKTVRMYNCGPTVYDFAHIGNWRAFVFADTLRRVLEYFGYKVIQVMNITDVGHLTSDDDLGEDKILKGLKRERERQGKELTVYDVINFYTKHFLNDLQELNIKKPTYMPKATGHVQEMINLIKTLIDKGYAYVTKSAVYFDVRKFKEYTKLYPQALDEKIVGARAEVNVDPEKKHPADFRLWQLDQPNHLLEWDSPWGRGFPGWHIECSAMSMKYLGPTLDIHTGGVDHIPVHHTNEIAQSEAATGKEFSRFWMHNEMLTVEGGKMSKSLGNFYTLADVKKMGFKPMHLRYFYLTAKYRAKLDFSKSALEAAKNAFEKLNLMYQIDRSAFVKEFIESNKGKTWEELLGGLEKVFSEIGLEDTEITYKQAYKNVSKKARPFVLKFSETVANDLNTPQALKVLWEVVKNPEFDLLDKLVFYSLAKKVLGLKFRPAGDPIYEMLKVSKYRQVEELLELIKRRDKAKQSKDYDTADSIKAKLQKMGYNVVDHIKYLTVIYGAVG